MKRLFVLLLTFAMLLSIASCKKDSPTNKNNNTSPNASSADGTSVVKLPDVVTGSIVFKNLGVVSFELYPNMAPQSALNFIYLANIGHYNGIIVDRLQKDFVIQAGTYEKGYVRREVKDYTIKGEFEANGVENKLTFTKGAIAWALTGSDYDSAHTEFCIYPYTESTWDLQGKYAVFGYVTDGFDVLDKINKRKVSKGRPSKDILITSVTIDPVDQKGFTEDYKFPEPNFLNVKDKSDKK